MAIERARKHLAKFGQDKNILEFAQSSATVELAAQAVGCVPGQIAKTLSFRVGEEIVLIVCAGNVKIDNRKYKDKFHTKASMLAFDEVEPLVGHAVGGVCPFGINDGVKVYLDESLKRFDHVYPACGSDNSAIKLTPSELFDYTENAQWCDVCK